MLLDSNIVIYGANESHPRLDEILARPDLAVASITRIETLGYHLLRETEREALELALSRMRTLPLDDETVTMAIRLRQSQRIALGDAVIAATALVHGLTLVTRNTADFRLIDGLDLLDPLLEPPTV